MGGGLIILGLATGSVAASSQASERGPILTFAAAVLVALITWYATDRRQERQIAAERQREAQRLRAERERLDRQLAAEREREDVQHLREFLDELAREVELCAGAYTDASSALEELVKLRSSGGLGSEFERTVLEAESHVAGLRQQAQKVIIAGRERHRRAQLRLEPDHPLMAAHKAFLDLLERGIALLKLEARDPVDCLNEASELSSKAFREWRNLSDEARRLVGAQVANSHLALSDGGRDSPSLDLSSA